MQVQFCAHLLCRFLPNLWLTLGLIAHARGVGGGITEDDAVAAQPGAALDRTANLEIASKPQAAIQARPRGAWHLHRRHPSRAADGSEFKPAHFVARFVPLLCFFPRAAGLFGHGQSPSLGADGLTDGRTDDSTTTDRRTDGWMDGRTDGRLMSVMRLKIILGIYCESTATPASVMN